MIRGLSRRPVVTAAGRRLGGYDRGGPLETRGPAPSFGDYRYRTFLLETPRGAAASPSVSFDLGHCDMGPRNLGYVR